MKIQLMGNNVWVDDEFIGSVVGQEHEWVGVAAGGRRLGRGKLLKRDAVYAVVDNHVKNTITMMNI